MTRVFMIPDSEGVIRVSCGNDTLEIQIATAASSPPASPSPPSPSTQSSPPNTPTPPPSTSSPGPFDTVFNPFDLPGAYIHAPRDSDGKVDLRKLVREILDQTENPALPDPSGVVLSSDNANLHDVSALCKKIAEAAPTLSFGLDFSGRWKP